MSGWHSLQSVGTLHIILQIAGLAVAAVVIAANMTAYHFWNRWDDLVALADRARNRYLPRWRTNTADTVHNAMVEVGVLGLTALLALGYAASQYGERKEALKAGAHAASLAKLRDEADVLRRALTERDVRAGNMTALRQSMREAEVRHLAELAALRRELEQAQPRRAVGQTERDTEAARLAAEIEVLNRAAKQTTARHAVEIAELQQRLRQTESRRVASVESLRWEVRQAESRAATEIARLEEDLAGTRRKLASLQAVRRLSIEEKYALIDALRPFAGQRVTIAAIEGDEDGKSYAADFVEVFEAAGWDYPAVSYERWERDPVGIEITLNEADGRAGRVSHAVGALINVTRRLSLTDGNTIYMNGDVPAGQVLLKVGKKRPR